MTSVAAAGGAVALGVGAPAAGAATASPPTLAVAFTPSEIGVTQSAGITYTITNPNSSGSLYNVAFSDTLPAGATIDNPPSVTTSGCGSPEITAYPGAGTASAAAITVKAGTPCLIQFSVVASSAGSAADTPGPLTYGTSATSAQVTAPSSNETPATLEVLAAPTVAVATPVANAKYTYGEKVKAQFSCTAPSDANGTTLSGCLATDELGNSYNPGDPLDTTDPGKHTLTVQALDNDGDSANASVNYTVLPNNAVTLKSAAAAAKGGLKLGLAVPGAGTVKVAEAHGRTVVGSKTVKVTSAKSALALALAPNATGRRLLAASVPTPKKKTTTKKAKKSKKAESLKVIVSVTYTPTGGVAKTVTKPVTLKSA